MQCRVLPACRLPRYLLPPASAKRRAEALADGVRHLLLHLAGHRLGRGLRGRLLQLVAHRPHRVLDSAHGLLRSGLRAGALAAGGRTRGSERRGCWVGRSVGRGWEETDGQKDRQSRRESARGRQNGRKEGTKEGGNEGTGRDGGRSGRGMRLREKERDEINNELAPSEIRRSRVVWEGGREVGRRDSGCGFRGGGMMGRGER